MEGSEIWISFRRIWISIPPDFDFVPAGFDFLPTDFEFLPRVSEVGKRTWRGPASALRRCRKRRSTHRNIRARVVNKPLARKLLAFRALRRRLGRGLRPFGGSFDVSPRPNPDVVKRRAPKWSDAVGAGQRVDAASVEEVAIVPQALADDDAAGRSRRPPNVHADLAARVAEAHDVALVQSEPRHVVGVHQRARAALAGERGRGLVEARIEEVARGRGRELEGMGFVRPFVDRPMVGQGWQAAPRAAEAIVVIRHVRPVGTEMELAVAVREAVEEMRVLERGLAVEPARGLELRERTPSG